MEAVAEPRPACPTNTLEYNGGPYPEGPGDFQDRDPRANDEASGASPTINGENHPDEGEADGEGSPDRNPEMYEPVRRRPRLSLPMFEAPEFTKRLNSFVEAEVGATVIFECHYRGFPPPSFTWYRDDEELVNGEDSVHFNHVDAKGILQLIVDGARKRDEGAYKCKIENEEGSAGTTGYLSVTGIETEPTIAQQQKKAPKAPREGRSVSLPPHLRTIVEQKSVEEREAEKTKALPRSPLQDFIDEASTRPSRSGTCPKGFPHSAHTPIEDDAVSSSSGTSVESQAGSDCDVDIDFEANIADDLDGDPDMAEATQSPPESDRVWPSSPLSPGKPYWAYPDHEQTTPILTDPHPLEGGSPQYNPHPLEGGNPGHNPNHYNKQHPPDEVHTGNPGNNPHPSDEVHTGNPGTNPHPSDEVHTGNPGNNPHPSDEVHTGNPGTNPHPSDEVHTSNPGNNPHPSDEVHTGNPGNNPHPSDEVHTGNPGNNPHPSDEVHTGNPGTNPHPSDEVHTSNPGNNPHPSDEVHTGNPGNNPYPSDEVHTGNPGNNPHPSDEVHTGNPGNNPHPSDEVHTGNPGNNPHPSDEVHTGNPGNNPHPSDEVHTGNPGNNPHPSDEVHTGNPGNNPHPSDEVHTGNPGNNPHPSDEVHTGNPGNNPHPSDEVHTGNPGNNPHPSDEVHTGNPGNNPHPGEEDPIISPEASSMSAEPVSPVPVPPPQSAEGASTPLAGQDLIKPAKLQLTRCDALPSELDDPAFDPLTPSPPVRLDSLPYEPHTTGPDHSESGTAVSDIPGPSPDTGGALEDNGEDRLAADNPGSITQPDNNPGDGEKGRLAADNPGPITQPDTNPGDGEKGRLTVGNPGSITQPDPNPGDGGEDRLVADNPGPITQPDPNPGDGEEDRLAADNPGPITPLDTNPGEGEKDRLTAGNPGPYQHTDATPEDIETDPTAIGNSGTPTDVNPGEELSGSKAEEVRHETTDTVSGQPTGPDTQDTTRQPTSVASQERDNHLPTAEPTVLVEEQTGEEQDVLCEDEAEISMVEEERPPEIDGSGLGLTADDILKLSSRFTDEKSDEDEMSEKNEQTEYDVETLEIYAGQLAWEIVGDASAAIVQREKELEVSAPRETQEDGDSSDIALTEEKEEGVQGAAPSNVISPHGNLMDIGGPREEEGPVAGEEQAVRASVLMAEARIGPGESENVDNRLNEEIFLTNEERAIEDISSEVKPEEGEKESPSGHVYEQPTNEEPEEIPEGGVIPEEKADSPVVRMRENRAKLRKRRANLSKVLSRSFETGTWPEVDWDMFFSLLDSSWMYFVVLSVLAAFAAAATEISPFYLILIVATLSFLGFCLFSSLDEKVVAQEETGDKYSTVVPPGVENNGENESSSDTSYYVLGSSSDGSYTVSYVPSDSPSETSDDTAHQEGSAPIDGAPKVSSEGGVLIEPGLD